MWQDKNDDSEIVLQLLHTFYRMLHFQETREELLYSTESMADICDCVGSKNRAIRVNADKVRAGQGSGQVKRSERKRVQRGWG